MGESRDKIDKIERVIRNHKTQCPCDGCASTTLKVIQQILDGLV